jgi:hypothetical protein
VHAYRFHVAGQQAPPPELDDEVPELEPLAEPELDAAPELDDAPLPDPLPPEDAPGESSPPSEPELVPMGTGPLQFASIEIPAPAARNGRKARL